VAHDFNNLISVINGYTEILHHRLEDKIEVHKELHEIHQASHRAASLVRQLLAFGRRQVMDPRVIELNRLVREHIDLVARLLGEQRSLEIDLADDTGNVHVDPTQLQQVFLNLVLNARDATKEGGRIGVATRNVTVPLYRNRRSTDLKPGEYVQLSVSDNGVGMDEETRSTLFEPFFTTKSENQGTGLGLALVYGVVTQSGGHIRVNSQPGQGSTFDVYLPRSHEPVDPVQGKLTPLPVTRGRETLLIIEADTVIRKMLEGILSADGYEVLGSGSCCGAETELKKANNGNVHMLIADPLADNGEAQLLARRLNRAHKGLRLINIPSLPAEPVRGIASTHQTVLQKPFALSTLLYEVRSLLDAQP
jgi:two-component sensor histidine kinase